MLPAGLIISLLMPIVVLGSTSTTTIFYKGLPPMQVVTEKDSIMEDIAWCESRDRQFNDDGTVLRGWMTPEDVGRYQINEYWWLDKSIELGFDIYTEEGNEAMARWLYNKYGTEPWNASEYCWSV